jgi:hypothetical protein
MFIKKKPKIPFGVSIRLIAGPYREIFFTFEPLEKIQDIHFLLKTHMKQVKGSSLSINAKFQPCRL